jgi:FkbM family methyltransferase
VKSLIQKALDRAGYTLKQHRNLVGMDWARDVLHLLGGRVDVAFDVGANVGQTVRYFAERFPKATIHAFEPVAGTHAELVRSVGSWPRVHCHCLALSDTDANREIITTGLSVHSSFSSELNIADPSAKRETVTTITADSFCQQHSIAQIDVLKIDTEGHEMAVLDGAVGLLSRRAVRAVYAEVTPNKVNRHNTQFNRVFDCLTGYSYNFMGLYEIEQLQSLPAETAYCNALFVVRE